MIRAICSCASVELCLYILDTSHVEIFFMYFFWMHAPDLCWVREVRAGGNILKEGMCAFVRVCAHSCAHRVLVRAHRAHACSRSSDSLCVPGFDGVHAWLPACIPRACFLRHICHTVRVTFRCVCGFVCLCVQIILMYACVSTYCVVAGVRKYKVHGL